MESNWIMYPLITAMMAEFLNLYCFRIFTPIEMNAIFPNENSINVNLNIFRADERILDNMKSGKHAEE